ncbi:UNVERIFIED_CONTAM: hypothetical protein Slati_2477400 [Sesamum latifolium]|uniref:Uncharacterized protein n=1 Tax=Sesamum latifolium TaxID=2727402 RepID=A0AAW2WDX4_9LAMI
MDAAHPTWRRRVEVTLSWQTSHHKRTPFRSAGVASPREPGVPINPETPSSDDIRWR